MSKTPGSATEDADEENDSDALAAIRAPNESPERRAATVDAFAHLEYVDYLDTDVYVRSVAKNHKMNDKSIGALFVMAIGDPEYDTMLDNPPFSETKKKKHTKHFRPTNQMMMDEVQRRAHFISGLTDDDQPNPFLKNGKILLPKPAQWSREKLTNWLRENVLMFMLSDMQYMQKHVKAYKTVLSNSLNKKKNRMNLDESIWGRSGWEGIVPNVRLIQIITSDSMKEAFIHRNDVDTRLQLDSRNTESARISFYEQVRIKFNNPEYFVTSLRLEPTWGGQVFLDPHPCNWEQLYALNMTPIVDEAACKRHFMKLNNTLGTVHRRWAQSGNGDEQLLNGNEENVEVQGGDKLDFVDKENVTCMYLWYMLLKAGIFDHSKSDLPDAIKADGQAPNINILSSASSRRSQRSKASNESNLPLIEEVSKMKDMMERESSFQRNESKWQRTEAQQQKHRSNLYAVMHLLLNNKKDVQSDIDKMEQSLEKNKENLFTTEDKLISLQIEKCSEQHIKLYEDRVESIKTAIRNLDEKLTSRRTELTGIVKETDQ
jgi:hypothetical protein